MGSMGGVERFATLKREGTPIAPGEFHDIGTGVNFRDRVLVREVVANERPGGRGVEEEHGQEQATDEGGGGENEAEEFHGI